MAVLLLLWVGMKELNLRENRHPGAKANAHVAQRVNII